MDKFVSTLTWVPIDAEEKPDEFEEVFIIVDYWSSVIDDWIHNSIQISAWHPSFDAFSLSLNSWSKGHEPRVKYWAHKPKVDLG